MTQRLLSLAAMIIAPPFAFLAGIIGAVVIWILLGETNLPGWGRLGLSLMAITAIPGLWFIVLPILFGANRSMRVGSDEFQAWQDGQVKTWEHHRAAFEDVGRQRIERVIASGLAVTANDTTITLIAVALGPHGGDITLIQSARGQSVDESHSLSDFVAELHDDLGNTYHLLTAPSQMTPVGARSNIAFVPCPPREATELRLVIPEAVQLGQTESRIGPWEFVIPVTRFAETR